MFIEFHPFILLNKGYRTWIGRGRLAIIVTIIISQRTKFTQGKFIRLSINTWSTPIPGKCCPYLSSSSVVLAVSQPSQSSASVVRRAIPSWSPSPFPQILCHSHSPLFVPIIVVLAAVLILRQSSTFDCDFYLHGPLCCRSFVLPMFLPANSLENLETPESLHGC